MGDVHESDDPEELAAAVEAEQLVELWVDRASIGWAETATRSVAEFRRYIGVGSRYRIHAAAPSHPTGEERNR